MCFSSVYLSFSISLSFQFQLDIKNIRVLKAKKTERINAHLRNQAVKKSRVWSVEKKRSIIKQIDTLFGQKNHELKIIYKFFFFAKYNLRDFPEIFFQRDLLSFKAKTLPVDKRNRCFVSIWIHLTEKWKGSSPLYYVLCAV